MPTPAIPSNAQGPYGESLTTFVAPSTSNGLPSITYYGRSADITLIRTTVEQQLAAFAPDTYNSLQALALAGARVAVVIQYDTSTNSVGWVTDTNSSGTIVQLPAPVAEGANTYFITAPGGTWAPDPNDAFDIVVVIDAADMFAYYGTRDPNTNQPTEIFRSAQTFHITAHEFLHPTRGPHAGLSQAQAAGTTITSAMVLSDQVYTLQFEAMYNFGIPLRVNGQLLDPRPGASNQISLVDYKAYLAQYVADTFNGVTSTISPLGTVPVGINAGEVLFGAVPPELQQALEQFFDQQTIQNIENAGQWGRQFASVLASSLPIEDPFVRVSTCLDLATIRT